MRNIAVTLIILTIAAQVGCARKERDDIYRNSMLSSLPFVYKMPVQQGNIVTRDMVDQLQPGMNKAQVRYLLGTPMLTLPKTPTLLTFRSISGKTLQNSGALDGVGDRQPGRTFHRINACARSRAKPPLPESALQSPYTSSARLQKASTSELAICPKTPPNALSISGRKTRNPAPIPPCRHPPAAL
jgi:hypothetical protein